jgi:hypothetical protein
MMCTTHEEKKVDTANNREAGLVITSAGHKQVLVTGWPQALGPAAAKVATSSLSTDSQ